MTRSEPPALLAENLPEDDSERTEPMQAFRPGAEELHIGRLPSED